MTPPVAVTISPVPGIPPGRNESESEHMSFLDMVAKAKASGTQGDADYFLPDCKGIIDVERVIQHNGDKGTSVILTATVIECEAKKDGVVTHKIGAKVKKIYAISKFPTVAPGQLKGDILAIDGLKEEDLSAKDVGGMLSAIFEDDKSPMFELRGYRTAFNTRVIDRKAKGKENLTGVNFSHIENDAAEMAARAKAIGESLAKK